MSYNLVEVENDFINISPYPGASIDSFGRQRVSVAENVFDSKLVYSSGEFFYTTNIGLGGTATYLSGEAAVSLNTSTTSGSFSFRETKEYFNYTPGESKLAFLTGVLGDSSGNVTRLGYFNDANGWFFEKDKDNILNVVLRTNVSGSVEEIRVPQSEWNGDKLDGTTSDNIIDITKSQIYGMDWQWLGVGTIRFYIEDGNGILKIVHRIRNNNIRSTVYSKESNLPFRYEIRNVVGGAGTAGSMKQICSALIKESTGGISSQIDRGVDRGTSIVIVGQTFLPVISIRLKQQYINSTVVPKGFYISSVTKNVVAFRIILNPTLVGFNFTSVSGNSFFEFDVASTSYTGGSTLFVGSVAGASTVSNVFSQAVKIVSDSNNKSDILTIVAASFNANASVAGGFNWGEVL